jgi:hypothetical protein
MRDPLVVQRSLTDNALYYAKDSFSGWSEHVPDTIAGYGPRTELRP